MPALGRSEIIRLVAASWDRGGSFDANVSKERYSMMVRLRVVATSEYEGRDS